MNPNDFTGAPAYVTFNGVTFQIHDNNWSAKTTTVTVPVNSNVRGKMGEWEEYVMTVFTFQPMAFKSTLATVIPLIHSCYTPQMRGQRIRSNTDLPLVIQTADGLSITYTTAMVTKPCTLQLAPNKPLFGKLEITALRKKGDTGSTAGDHVVVASSAYTEPAIDPTDIINCQYAYAFGSSSPLNAIECDEEGVIITPKVKFEELKVGSQGLLNYAIDMVEVSAEFTPQNITSSSFTSALLIADGSLVGRGTLLSPRGLAFTVTGATTGDPIVTIPIATCKEGEQVFGTKPRVGKVTLEAQQKLSTTLQNLWAVTYAE